MMRTVVGQQRSIAKWFFCGAVMALAGCASAPRRAVPQAADSEDAQARAQEFLDTREQTIETVHAGLELEWISPRLERRASCRASMVFREPDLLRVRGTSAAFFTIFDLVADADTIRFDVPREEVLIRGTRSDPAWDRFPLDPDLVSVALVGVPGGDRGMVGARVVRDSEDSLRAVGPGGTVTFDPSTGMPRTYVSDDEGGGTIVWEDWSDIDGISWPMQVSFEWPSTGEKLSARFGRVQFGRPVREASFSEDPDDPREIMKPEEGLRRWDEALLEAGEAPESE